MSDYIDADGFRANVGIVLIRDDRQVFLGGRPGGRGWQFPQGGIARNEAPEQALFRELKEEVGLESGDVEVVASTRNWLRYRLPKQYLRRQSEPICIGQKQRWFLLKVKSGDQAFRFDTTSSHISVSVVTSASPASGVQEWAGECTPGSRGRGRSCG